MEVDSESDDRGMLGMDPNTSAGPSAMSIRIKVAATGVGSDQLGDLIATGAVRCPVCDATKRPVDINVEIDTG